MYKLKVCIEYDGDVDNYRSHEYELMDNKRFNDFIVGGHIDIVSPSLARTRGVSECEDELYEYFLYAKVWSEKELSTFANSLFAHAMRHNIAITKKVT